jgi:hypothetical protein
VIAFLVTIDTEGDNLWEAPRAITTRNAGFLPRFQGLCEKYGLKPTYLTNWEMAKSPAFIEFGREVLARNSAEIGMHLHAWNSPPLVPLTANDFQYQPYLIEYPQAVLKKKVKRMTECLESTFQVKMRSHRAGRWSFDSTYARALAELGYEVDCSVTPHHSWRSVKGDPNGAGGTDFTHYPDSAYFVDLADPGTPGHSALLEVPMTILPRKYSAPIRIICKAPLARKIWPEKVWLRPTGRNVSSMLWILEQAKARGRDYVEFMLHSSELMPGGSPTFPTAGSIEALYGDLEALFSAAREGFVGMTLAQYRRRFEARAKDKRAA